jgi:hypothetical protein
MLIGPLWLDREASRYSSSGSDVLVTDSELEQFKRECNDSFGCYVIRYTKNLKNCGKKMLSVFRSTNICE